MIRKIMTSSSFLKWLFSRLLWKCHKLQLLVGKFFPLLICSLYSLWKKNSCWSWNSLLPITPIFFVHLYKPLQTCSNSLLMSVFSIAALSCLFTPWHVKIRSSYFKKMSFALDFLLCLQRCYLLPNAFLHPGLRVGCSRTSNCTQGIEQT